MELVDNTVAFSLTFTYHGMPYKMTPLPKVTDQMLDEEIFITGLKIHLRGTYPEAVTSSVHGDECKLTLLFSH